MKIKNILLMSLTFATALLMNIGINNVHADNKSVENSAGFTAAPVIEQGNNKSSYFDYTLNPGDTKTLNVKVSNVSNKPKTLLVKPNQAITNSNAIIDYANDNGAITSKTNFKSIVSDYQGKTVTLDPEKTATVPFTITMPADKFSGIILGSFVVSDKNAAAAAKNNKETTINQIYQYAIAAVIRSSDAAQIKPNLINSESKYTHKNSRPVVSTSFENTTGQAIFNSNMDVALYQGTKKIAERKNQSTSIAPNSKFNYVFDLATNQLSNGKYKIVYTFKYNKTVKHFTNYFTVNSKDVADVKNNTSNFEFKKNNNYLIWIVVGVVFGLMLFVIIILLMKNKKNNK